ncbi:hypothetical protein L1887_28097 [Cichorium endivia]|nr:hypothetical protein L1887_28097 [Cichorium endivia]
MPDSPIHFSTSLISIFSSSSYPAPTLGPRRKPSFHLPLITAPPPSALAAAIVTMQIRRRRMAISELVTVDVDLKGDDCSFTTTKRETPFELHRTVAMTTTALPHLLSYFTGNELQLEDKGIKQ